MHSEEQGKDLCTFKEKSITFNLVIIKDLYFLLYDNKRLINFKILIFVTDCSFNFIKEMIKRLRKKS